MSGLTRLHVRNFRSLADVDVELGAVNVLFGPNGSGKSSLLDAIWFVHDCADRGVDFGSSQRSHGIGMLWYGADARSNISIAFETDLSRYEVLFACSSGRINPDVGERLEDKTEQLTFIDRKIGTDEVTVRYYETKRTKSKFMIGTDKLALTLYRGHKTRCPVADEIDGLLQMTHMFSSRGFHLKYLKRLGSESDHQTCLDHQSRRLWSVLRNLHDRRNVDNRYDTIVEFMSECFPDFKDLFIEQTGPNSVYGYFLVKSLRQPLAASVISDGHLQMLILLTALFSEGTSIHPLLLLDEPETSLHPWALAVLARGSSVPQKNGAGRFLSRPTLQCLSVSSNLIRYSK